MRSQAVIDAIAALSPGYDPRSQWPFAEHARRAGGRLVGPWNDVSRQGLARRIGPTGLDEWGPHNLLLNSDTLSTQSVTTTAQQYTLKFSGSGTVTLSGTATGTLSAGTAAFTATAGTLTLTVSGSVTAAQLNVGPVATEYVPTTTTARYLPRITHDPALDINGLPYTVTEQYGAELVANGNFSSPPSGYTAISGTTLLTSGGVGSVTANATGGYRGSRLNLNGVTVGKTYRATVKTRVTVGSSSVSIGFIGGVRSAGTTSATFVTQTVFFVADATTIYLDILFNSGSPTGATDAFELDDLSAQEYLGTVTTGTPRPLGLLVEGQGTNLYPVSDTPSARTVTVTAAAHTLSVYGACTITLSGAATGTLTATGAANIRTTLTFTPSAGSLTMTVSGLTTGNRAQLEAGSVATSYIPNPGTGSAARVADSAGPGVALTGAALAAAFPGGVTQPFTSVIRYRKGYSAASNETLFALSAGASAGGTNLLALRINGTQAQLVHSGGTGSLTGTLVHDGSTVNRIAVSVDPAGGRMSISVNGSAAVETTGIAYTGAGVAALIPGSQTYAGTEPMGAAVISAWDNTRTAYITGAALQALST